MENNITYDKAYKELTKINEELENHEIDVDKLTAKIQRARELIQICRNQLKLTEDETKKILEQFDK